MCLGILQAFVPNVGDAWQFTLQALSGYWKGSGEVFRRVPGLPYLNLMDPLPLTGRNLPAPVLDYLNPYLDAVQLLGRRTAELHLALAFRTGRSSLFARCVHASVSESLQRNTSLVDRNGISLSSERS